VSNTEYQIYRMPLSSAGSDTINVQANYFKLLWAGTIDSAGKPQVMDLACVVEVSIGTRDDDYLPMSINTLVEGESTRYRLRWNAQPGKWAFFLISAIDPRGAGIKVDAPPTQQLVTSSMGSALAVSRVSVGTSAAQIAAASTTRQKLTIKNTHATATLYVGAGNTVTTANGFPVGPGEGFTFEGTTAEVWGISDTAATGVAVLAEG